jgi:histidine ammonia-lyase
VTAAALVAEIRILATPASVQSITTSGNKEDFVSMGMTAALKLWQAVEHTARVLAIEAICAAQALDFLLPLQTGPRAQPAHRAIRATSPRVTADRPLAADIEAVAALLRRGGLTSG